MLRWNELYPFDYFYRKKYNIPFGSPEHRATNFILMAVDLKEHDMIQEYIEEMKTKEAGLENINNGLKMSKKEVDEEFDNLDISKFNEHGKEHEN